MSKFVLTGKHILLFLLYSPGKTSSTNEPICGRTRIIKTWFLFKNIIKTKFLKGSNLTLKFLPEFFPWHYGPFSKDVYNDIEFFINNGFIYNSPLDTKMTKFEFDEYEDWIEDFSYDFDKELLLNSPNQESFQLTDKGISFIAPIYDKLTQNQKDIIIKIKQGINEGSLEALIRYTYLKFPKYTKKSVIKDQIFG